MVRKGADPNLHAGSPRWFNAMFFPIYCPRPESNQRFLILSQTSLPLDYTGHILSNILHQILELALNYCLSVNHAKRAVLQDNRQYSESNRNLYRDRVTYYHCTIPALSQTRVELVIRNFKSRVDTNLTTGTVVGGRGIRTHTGLSPQIYSLLTLPSEFPPIEVT